MRRIFCIIIFMFVFSMSFAGSAEKEGNLIRYGGQYYPGEFLLDGHDFFSEFGLNVKHTLFSSGTENNEALISGNIDVNVGSDSKSVALFNAIGDKALIIGTVQRGNRYSTMIRKDAPYKDWADLKGKQVGTRFGTGAEFVLRKYFDSRDDLSWDDFEWVNVKTEDMIAALANGQIEAFTVWAPGDVALTPVLIHTTADFKDKNRDLLVRFLAAHLKKAELIKNDPGLAAEYAAKAAKEKGINVSADAFKLIFERINFQIEFDESIIEELKKTAAFLQSQKKIDSIPEFNYDMSLINDAKKLIEK